MVIWKVKCASIHCVTEVLSLNRKPMLPGLQLSSGQPPILLLGRNNSHQARGPSLRTLAVDKIPQGRASSQSAASREDAQLGRDMQGKGRTLQSGGL